MLKKDKTLILAQPKLGFLYSLKTLPCGSVFALLDLVEHRLHGIILGEFVSDF